MAVSIATTRVAADTGGGNQTITNPGGFVPKAVLFFSVNAIADDTAIVDNVMGIGACDADSEWATTHGDEDNVGTTDTNRQNFNSRCIMLEDPNGTVIGMAEFVSLNANNVIVNWTNTPTSAFLITAVFFGGSDLAADVHVVTMSTEDTDVDVTAPGFEPDVVIFACTGDSVNGGGGVAVSSIGFFVNDGSATQAAYLWSAADGSANTDVNAIVESDRVGGQIFAGSVDWAAEISDPDANGYTATARGGASGGDALFALALNFNSVVEAHAEVLDSPTSTGSEAYAGFGLQPVFLLLIPNHRTAADSVGSDGTAGTFPVAAMDATNQYCQSGCSEDGAGTTNTQTISDDQAVNSPEDDGTIGFEATLTSMDADGFTLNFSATLGTACKWPVLAIGGGAPPSNTRRYSLTLLNAG